MTYFIEVHKAKHMYKVLRDHMALLDKCSISAPVKNEMKINLNKVLQYLSLKQLKVIDENNIRHNKPEEAIQQS